MVKIIIWMTIGVWAIVGILALVLPAKASVPATVVRISRTDAGRDVRVAETIALVRRMLARPELGRFDGTYVAQDGTVCGFMQYRDPSMHVLVFRKFIRLSEEMPAFPSQLGGATFRLIWRNHCRENRDD